MTASAKEFRTSLQALRYEIPSRLSAPWGSMTFWCHLVVGVVACGGLGIWNAIYQTQWNGWRWEDIAAALYTYFPAIAATALLEFHSEEQEYWKSFGLFWIIPFVIIFFFASTVHPMWMRFVIAFGGTLLALLFWCVAIGANDCFRDLKPEAATPAPDAPLQGDSKGWKK